VTGYAELQVTSNYSFLRGASHVEELMAQAKLLGLPAMAITDRNTLAGIARAHQRADEVGIRFVVGCRLDLSDNLPVLVYPTDRAAYARLCRLHRNATATMPLHPRIHRRGFSHGAPDAWRYENREATSN